VLSVLCGGETEILHYIILLGNLVKEESGGGARGEAKREDLGAGAGVCHDDQGYLAYSPTSEKCHNRSSRVTGHLNHGAHWGQKEQKAEGKGEGN